MHNPQLPQQPFDPDDMCLGGVTDEPLESSFSSPPAQLAVPPACIPPCPKCQSTRVDARNRARKTGSAIGTLAGTTSGIAFALSGAETGAAVGLLAGPAGAVCGAIAGAVIAGLIGGAAGCATGSVFGEIVDEKVLDNFRCYACGHTFSRSRSSN